MNETKQNELIIKNLNNFIKNTEKLTYLSLIKCYMVIEEDAIDITPKDTGWLRQGFYKKKLMTKSGQVGIEIGNDKNYALYVHENMEANFKEGGPKFLTRAIVKNTERIKDIINNEVRL